MGVPRLAGDDTVQVLEDVADGLVDAHDARSVAGGGRVSVPLDSVLEELLGSGRPENALSGHGSDDFLGYTDGRGLVSDLVHQKEARAVAEGLDPLMILTGMMAIMPMTLRDGR